MSRLAYLINLRIYDYACVFRGLTLQFEHLLNLSVISLAQN
jgi:hypothetical protein